MVIWFWYYEIAAITTLSVFIVPWVSRVVGRMVSKRMGDE
jgi:hypothetical protein